MSDVHASTRVNGRLTAATALQPPQAVGTKPSHACAPVSVHSHALWGLKGIQACTLASCALSRSHTQDVQPYAQGVSRPSRSQP